MAKLTKVNYNLSSVAKINESKLQTKSVALHVIISTGSTFVGALCSTDGATSVRLVSLGGRCLSFAMT